MQAYVDVIVPRGGKGLVGLVQREARVPVFAHLEGIVHIYIDKAADPETVLKVVLNAKTRRTGICGAAECLLIHEAVAEMNDDDALADIQVVGQAADGQEAFDLARELMPDVILIDGGKGQLNASVEVLREYGLDHLPIFGLAKREEEVFVPGHEDPILLPRNSQGRFLIQRVRDEAHRFAITYHRRVRRKETVVSQLDGVPGVGPKRRSALLQQFGSIQAIREASVEELAAVPSMTRKVAEQLKASL